MLREVSQKAAAAPASKQQVVRDDLHGPCRQRSAQQSRRADHPVGTVGVSLVINDERYRIFTLRNILNIELYHYNVIVRRFTYNTVRVCTVCKCTSTLTLRVLLDRCSVMDGFKVFNNNFSFNLSIFCGCCFLRAQVLASTEHEQEEHSRRRLLVAQYGAGRRALSGLAVARAAVAARRLATAPEPALSYELQARLLRLTRTMNSTLLNFVLYSLQYSFCSFVY